MLKACLTLSAHVMAVASVTGEPRLACDRSSTVVFRTPVADLLKSREMAEDRKWWKMVRLSEDERKQRLNYWGTVLTPFVVCSLFLSLSFSLSHIHTLTYTHSPQ